MTLCDRLWGRIGDMLVKSRRGEVTATDFMSPADAAAAALRLRLEPVGALWTLYGGYGDAERVMLFILPDYMEAWDPTLADDFIEAVHVVGSGYENLSHSDFMGAVLALGIARDAVGDIVTLNSHEAVIFAKPSVARFLYSEEHPLERVGRDVVRVLPYEGDGGDLVRAFIEITGVITSERFDCVIAELCGLSRADAKARILSGEAKLNYAEADVSDCVSEGDVLSVRGCGKFKILSIGSRTKKDRLRLRANKYI